MPYSNQQVPNTVNNSGINNDYTATGPEADLSHVTSDTSLASPTANQQLNTWTAKHYRNVRLHQHITIMLMLLLLPRDSS